MVLASSGLKIDAYLQWAMRPGVRLFEQRRSKRVVLLVQFCLPLDEATYRRLIGSGMWCSEYFKGYAYVTVTVPVASLAEDLKILGDLGAIYCELGSADAPDLYEITSTSPNPQPGPETVIGIVDDGCPFAHRAYRPSGPGPSVQYLWDQGGPPSTGTVPGNPSPSGYGAVYTTQIATAVAKATNANGEVDEDHAYSLIPLAGLRGMVSHGAQVMSHAAGSTRKVGDHPQPPALSASVGIAFVQLRPKALDDPTGYWIDSDGIEALQAIYQYARTMIAPPLPPSKKKVLINLSYGPQTGPHDGSSFAEGKINELAQEAENDGNILQVVLPSGNSHLLQAHAEFNLHQLGATAPSIDWYVAADSRAYSALEIWLPSPVTTNDVVIRVYPPASTVETVSTMAGKGSSLDAEITTVPNATSSGACRVLIMVSPTARSSTDSVPATFPPTPLATPGRWRVSMEAAPGGQIPASAPCVAHLYLQRSDPNMGRSTGGRSGYLRSQHYGDKVGSLPSEQLEPNPSGMGKAEVYARGSLSGIATGKGSLVAAGYRLRDNLPASFGGAVVVSGVRRDKLPAPYSSGGPSRGSGTAQHGPDWAYPTEESRVLAGRLGRGNRSGVSMRFSGTSIASPQLVRELAAVAGKNFPDPLPVNPPHPSWFAPRFGNGTR